MLCLTLIRNSWRIADVILTLMKSMPAAFGMQLPWQLYCRVTQINFPPVTKCPVRFFGFFFFCAIPCAREAGSKVLRVFGFFFFLRNLAL